MEVVLSEFKEDVASDDAPSRLLSLEQEVGEWRSRALAAEETVAEQKEKLKSAEEQIQQSLQKYLEEKIQVDLWKRRAEQSADTLQESQRSNERLSKDIEKVKDDLQDKEESLAHMAVKLLKYKEMVSHMEIVLAKFPITIKGDSREAEGGHLIITKNPGLGYIWLRVQPNSPHARQPQQKRISSIEHLQVNEPFVRIVYKNHISPDSFASDDAQEVVKRIELFRQQCNESED